MSIAATVNQNTFDILDHRRWGFFISKPWALAPFFSQLLYFCLFRKWFMRRVKKKTFLSSFYRQWLGLPICSGFISIFAWSTKVSSSLTVVMEDDQPSVFPVLLICYLLLHLLHPIIS